MITVNICTGYPLDSPKGNSVTAKRLERLLSTTGFQATAMCSDTPPKADALIALHALKTAQATIHFRRNNPSAKVIIQLTGTDINGGFEQQPQLANQVIEMADHLVVAQSACIKDIPKKWHDKITTIYPSIQLPKIPNLTPAPSVPLFTNLGHLREVKNPHLLFRAIQEIPQTPLMAASLGNSLTTKDKEIANKNMQLDERYQWLAGYSRAKALSWMKSSTATINTSFSEGGANTIIEAIHLGCPILASDISGNRGLLGDDYLGYFPNDDAAALAKLIIRCSVNSSFLNELKDQLRALKPRFSEELEFESWSQLLH